MTDEELAFAYLEGGRWKSGRGLRRIFAAFPTTGAEEERARQALARILRNGPKQSILLLLASLIHADQEIFQRRRFVIRSRGRVSDYARDVAVARHIVERRAAGAQEIDAVEEAIEIYGGSVPTARRAYKKYRSMWERYRVIK